MDKWESYFKSEVRSKGEALLGTSKVTLSVSSDMEAQCFFRASTGFKVVLRTASITDTHLSAQCTCPQSNKQFCKHMWAALRTLENQNPDFLEGKKDLELITGKNSESSLRSKATEVFKKKQSDYRKAQYQIQKARSFKELKKTKVAVVFPANVEKALDYFAKNGFLLSESLDEESVGLARKKLARVFHPDRGGTHSEILELNQYTEILLDYIELPL